MKKDNSADCAEQHVKFFRQSSPYIHAHKGKTFVIMLGGDTLAHQNLNNIISDVALMSSLGVRLVLVHCACPQADDRLGERGIKTVIHKGTIANERLYDGRRITDKLSLDIVKNAVGNARTLIESKLSVGLVNSPMHGARIRVVSGNFVTARPLGVLDGIDFQHTGEVRKIDSQSIDQLLDSGYVVLLSCLGLSPTGEIFNIEVEEVATRTAISLGAEKLILYGEQQGVFDYQGNLIHRISPHEASNELESQVGESRRLLSSAIIACSEGVERAQIISYQDDGSLLMELFTRDGVGTLISRDHYEEVRGATIDDVGGILELIRPFEEKGVLRRRSRKELEREIRLFSVVLLDGMIIGCAALHPCNKNGVRRAELACVVVHPEYRQAHRGDRLLEHIEALAKDKDMDEVYVMTTQTAHWFMERGFTEVAYDKLSEDLKAKYNPKRRSKVLMKKIS